MLKNFIYATYEIYFNIFIFYLDVYFKYFYLINY